MVRVLLFLLCFSGLAGCQKDGITIYQAPKEKPADVAMMAEGPSLHWTAPDYWVEQAPTGMRMGSFSITNTAGEGDLSIVKLPLQADRLLANVNRWRGQLSLPAISETELDQVNERAVFGQLSYTLVSVNADSMSFLIAILHTSMDTYFFKLSGPNAFIQKEIPSFHSFLTGVHFD